MRRVSRKLAALEAVYGIGGKRGMLVESILVSDTIHAMLEGSGQSEEWFRKVAVKDPRFAEDRIADHVGRKGHAVNLKSIAEGVETFLKGS